MLLKQIIHFCLVLSIKLTVHGGLRCGEGMCVCGGSGLVAVSMVTFTGSSDRDKRSEEAGGAVSSGACLFYCLWAGGHVGRSGRFVRM